MSTQDPAAAKGVPYREVSEPAFATVAATNFVLEEYGVGLRVLRGRCPRCAAFIDVPVVQEVVKGVSIAEQQRADDRDREPEPVMCTCEEPHEGRPQGRVGCGAYWNFVL